MLPAMLSKLPRRGLSGLRALKLSASPVNRSFSVTTTIRNSSPLDGSDTNFAHPTGDYARTDDTINIRYPGHGFLKEESPEHDGGRHFSRTLSSFSLEGKVCVVTGAARGLGYTMTQAFIESGAEVAIIDLNKQTAEESAQELGTWFRSQDEDASSRHTVTSGWGCDVSNEAQVKKTMDDIIAKHGKIDVLVTSAGYFALSSCNGLKLTSPGSLRTLPHMNIRSNGYENSTLSTLTELSSVLRWLLDISSIPVGKVSD